ncbi:hypothetical protein Tco_0765852 [Tanacetum coccineum]
METKDTLSSCSDSEEQQMKRMQDKAKERCMVSFRLLHSHLRVLSKNELNRTRTEEGFKRVFAKLFNQDVQIFKGTMFLNVDQLEKQLDKEEFQDWINESREQDTSSKSGNDADVDDAYIKPEYDEEPMAVHYKELYDSSNTTRAKTIEQTTSLIAQNAKFKAQIQEKVFANAALKNELRKLTGISVNTKFAKPSILGKPLLQSYRNQSVVRKPTAFKSERPRISKPRFASHVDVNNDLSKPVTTYYLPKEREIVVVKPHHVIASSESRNSSKNMPRFSSNDMVHNHYLEEARKKTQESGRNSKPSVMPSARSQSTTNGSKPKPRINDQKFRNWHASKSSCRIFKTDGLRWVPTEKIFTSNTTKVDSEPPHDSNTTITNPHECKQTLDLSASTSINVQKEQTLNLSARTPINREKIKVLIIENVIAGRPRSHGITLIKAREISARPSS